MRFSKVKMSKYTERQLTVLTIPALKQIAHNNHMYISSRYRKHEIIHAILAQQKRNKIKVPEEVKHVLIEKQVKSLNLNKKVKPTRFLNLPTDIYRSLSLYLKIIDIIKLSSLSKKLCDAILKNPMFLKNIGNLYLTDDDKLLPERNKMLRVITSISVESATKKGYLKFVIKNINKIKNFKFILYFAIFMNRLDIVEYLIANHQYKQHEIDRAIAVATGSGNLEMTKYILRLGGDLHFTDEWAFIEACKSGNLEVLKYILDMSERLTGRPVDINVLNSAALREAISYNHLEIVKYLLEHQINIPSVNDYLEIAISKGNLEMTKMLLDYGLDIHENEDIALREAVMRNNFEMIKLLIENGADIHCRDDFPLMQCVSNDRIHIVKYLITQGADIHGNNDSILSRAVLHSDVRHYLLFVGDFEEQPRINLED